MKICYVLTIAATVRAFFIPQLKYLSENGFEITVVCAPDANLGNELGKNIRYFPIDIPRGVSIKGSIHALKELTKFFKKENFDLIQYSTPNAAFYSSIAAKISKTKIRNYHIMGFRYLGANGLVRKILKMIEIITCYNSSHIECVSKSNLILGTREKIFSKNKATVVWNGSTGGVDLKRFNFKKREKWKYQVRNEIGYTSSDFIYAFIGRITKDKGIDELLEAFIKLNNGSKLILIGDIENPQKLNQELLNEAKNNSNIKFHQRVNDIERYYAAIDVIVLPSYREGFGNVIIEAAAVGTPAIISGIPGPIDAVEENKTAFICNPKDSDSLYLAMKTAFDKIDNNMMNESIKFAENKFNSEILNKKILERKLMLMREI